MPKCFILAFPSPPPPLPSLRPLLPPLSFLAHPLPSPSHLVQYVGTHYLSEVLLRHPVTLFLCAVHEDNVIGVQGHLVEEVEETLECVAVGPWEEKAEQTKRVSALATRLDT